MFLSGAIYEERVPVPGIWDVLESFIESGEDIVRDVGGVLRIFRGLEVGFL